ncbi:exopolysaccharide biosynthesis polyprenyl glycosylphosphotransferase [Mycolicibacterium chubuense NBB4]|uniref:Exopolysaccharide biosynthesis polyprenyl glycosylphosphotransferase n=1 Tax=Mycolicibacterium chubuense (strain NBB4) TaxID=710421 RepID=I4BFR2_MYCCN|nr:sugar transferase [Mycolicibacterium chubuense]AFM16119.1 exopolysaccharide biosynthesis polyprenyl glycosylphosphotransferase [Mycolicibacterium chubuense NBB4]
MQLDLEAASHTPSSRPTVPRLHAATQPAAAQTAPWTRFVDYLRAESGYVALTVGLDVWAAFWSVLFAQWSITGNDSRGVYGWSWAFVPILVIILSTRSLYKRRLSHRFLDEFEPVETSIAVASLFLLALMTWWVIPQFPAGTVLPEYVRPSEMMLRVWLWAAFLVPLVRLARSMAQRYLRRKHNFGVPALIVGSGPVAHQLLTRMRQVPDYGLRPVGLLDDQRPVEAEMLEAPYLGTTDNLEVIARARGAEELIIAPSTIPDEQLAHTAQLAQNLGMRVRVVPRLMDAVGGGATVEHLGGIPLMVLCHTDPKGWQFTIKHVMDRTVAAVGLLMISPVFLTLMLLVRFSSPGPIFFGQDRIGRDGKVFQCLKFRSMRPVDPDATHFELKDGAAPGGVEGEDRRTRIGKIMRKTSLDELPQLLNVLRGDMSLVGPRPERPEFVELFEMQIRRYGDRHRVKAGMTGWAQVHGLRGQTSIADRAEFDNYYIENWNILLDVKILLLTVLAVLRSAED